MLQALATTTTAAEHLQEGGRHAGEPLLLRGKGGQVAGGGHRGGGHCRGQQLTGTGQTGGLLVGWVRNGGRGVFIVVIATPSREHLGDSLQAFRLLLLVHHHHRRRRRRRLSIAGEDALVVVILVFIIILLLLLVVTSFFFLFFICCICSCVHCIAAFAVKKKGVVSVSISDSGEGRLAEVRHRGNVVGKWWW